MKEVFMKTTEQIKLLEKLVLKCGLGKIIADV